MSTIVPNKFETPNSSGLYNRVTIGTMKNPRIWENIGTDERVITSVIKGLFLFNSYKV